MRLWSSLLIGKLCLQGQIFSQVCPSFPKDTIPPEIILLDPLHKGGQLIFPMGRMRNWNCFEEPPPHPWCSQSREENRRKNFSCTPKFSEFHSLLFRRGCFPPTSWILPNKMPQQSRNKQQHNHFACQILPLASLVKNIQRRGEGENFLCHWSAKSAGNILSREFYRGPKTKATYLDLTDYMESS